MKFFPFLLLLTVSAFATSPERARDLGVIVGQFPPGPLDAITDVKGVRVGHLTLVSGEGKLIPGKGPVRTGVTAILPAPGDLWEEKVMAGSFVLNGNGEMTDYMWLRESGVLETPIVLTNTLSIGAAQRGLVDWMTRAHPRIGIGDDSVTPMVMECDDGTLNDIRGQHVLPEHVTQAIEKARSGAVEEGGVGAGTGMISYDFKGGIGTASRALPKASGGWTVGVLVNANHGTGTRGTFRMKGVAIGELIKTNLPVQKKDGSIAVVVATDAPLDSRQLSRLAKRAMLGVARTGTIGYNGSGDFAVAFSTANRIPHHPRKTVFTVKILSDFAQDDLFEATTDAAEEAVYNALLGAKTMVGRDGNTAYALPHEEIRKRFRPH